MWYDNEDNFPALIEAGEMFVVVNYYKNGKLYDIRDNPYDIINGNWKLASFDKLQHIYSKKDFTISYSEIVILYGEVHEQVKNEHLDNDFNEWLRYKELLQQRLQNLN